METIQTLDTGDTPTIQLMSRSLSSASTLLHGTLDGLTTPNLSNQNSPTNSITSLRGLFDYPRVDREYIAHKYTRSIIPKGRSILAKGGGGMSNDAVQYTNSRSFKNVYKGSGSLEPSKLLQGMALGLGMSKGQSILNSGGGLSGMSLFKMKHYNPLETSEDASGIKEGKHGEEKSAFDKDGILVTALDGNSIYDSNGKFFTDSRGRKIYDASGNKNIYDDGEKTHTSTVFGDLFKHSPDETVKRLISSAAVASNTKDSHIQATTTTVPAKQVVDAPMTSQKLQLDQMRENIAKTHKILDEAIANKKLHENKKLSDFKKMDEELLEINKVIQTTTDRTILFNVKRLLINLKPIDAGNPDTDAHFKQITDQMIKDITTKIDNQLANEPLVDESKQVLNAPLTDIQLKSKEMLELIEQSNKLLNEDTNTSKLENERVFNQMVKKREQDEAEEEKKKPKKTSSLKKDKKPKKEALATTEDLKGINVLTRIATDESGTMLKDKKGINIWGKPLANSSPHRTYIIETKIKNKWELVPAVGVSYPFHSFINVQRITKYADNSIFNNVGNSVIHGKFRVTLWTRELKFSDKNYYAA